MAESIRFHFDNIHFDAPLALGPYRVMQFGDLSAARHTCAPHIQRVHELSCIVSGAATFTCGGQTYAVRRGDHICGGVLFQQLRLLYRLTDGYHRPGPVNIHRHVG